MLIGRSQFCLRCGLGHFSPGRGCGVTSATSWLGNAIGNEDVEGSEPCLLGSTMVSKGIVNLEHDNGE
jgi:hypothetical protein